MSDATFKGLPVHGYKAQDGIAVQRVNFMKVIEENVLRALDELAASDDIDKRWLATGRTDIEKGFMAVNRSIFKPGRIALPEDEDGA